jgi:hypothetical protein
MTAEVILCLCLASPMLVYAVGVLLEPTPIRVKDEE